MKLPKGLNRGDRVRTTKEWDELEGIHHEGIINDCAPWGFKSIDLLTDEGKIVIINVGYIEKCE